VKRANGTGTIRYDERYKRYRVRVMVNGRRREVSGATQVEAWGRADELLKDPDPEGPTVEEWMTEFLRRVRRSGRLAGPTLDAYQYMSDRFIVPQLGDYRIAALRAADVERMLGEMTVRASGPKDRDGQVPVRPAGAWTVRQARAVLRRALTMAVRDGLITRNVAAREFVDGPRITDKKDRTLTPDQFRLLVSEMDSDPVGLCVVMMAATGLRRGELLGLEWSHLDLTVGTVTVRQSAKRDSRGNTYIDKPKTPRSRRTIYLPEFLVDRFRDLQAESRYVAVFPKVRLDGLTRSTSRFTKRVLGEAFSPHELRHSAASLMLAQGVPLKTVSETLGHSSIAITADTYGHLLPPARAEAAAAFDNLL
jgi:integrase